MAMPSHQTSVCVFLGGAGFWLLLFSLEFVFWCWVVVLLLIGGKVFVFLFRKNGWVGFGRFLW